ncbi:hypothetical protein THERMOT_460 [Bathymodiolus thermophilus thioautotrophic gill symbiont]|nr:hypothetical protein THERMOT_460 [Bathymodiolus thermophilus thioautotrophic gill symbiont]
MFFKLLSALHTYAKKSHKKSQLNTYHYNKYLTGFNAIFDSFQL